MTAEGRAVSGSSQGAEAAGRRRQALQSQQNRESGHSIRQDAVAETGVSGASAPWFWPIAVTNLPKLSIAKRNGSNDHGYR